MVGLGADSRRDLPGESIAYGAESLDHGFLQLPSRKRSAS